MVAKPPRSPSNAANHLDSGILILPDLRSCQIRMTMPDTTRMASKRLKLESERFLPTRVAVRIPASAQGINLRICFHWACRLYQLTAKISANIIIGRRSPTETLPPKAFARIGTTISPTPEIPVLDMPMSSPLKHSRIH